MMPTIAYVVKQKDTPSARERSGWGPPGAGWTA